MTRPLCAIVGAGEGLGRALAARFAAGGCDLALVSRGEAEAAPRRRPRGRPAPGPVSSPPTPPAPRASSGRWGEAAGGMGRVEVLIYNARDRFQRRALRSTSPTTNSRRRSAWRSSARWPPQGGPARHARARTGDPPLLERDRRLPRLGQPPALRHRQVRPARAGPEPRQGLREGRGARRAHAARLRSRHAAHCANSTATPAKPASWPIRRRRRDLLVGPPPAQGRLEQRGRGPPPHGDVDVLERGRPRRARDRPRALRHAPPPSSRQGEGASVSVEKLVDRVLNSLASSSPFVDGGP